LSCFRSYLDCDADIHMFGGVNLVSLEGHFFQLLRINS